MKDNKNNIDKLITQDKVLFFDMDGTLVDTDYANYLSYKMAIQAVINPNELIQFNPKERFNRTVLLKKFPNLNEKDFQEIIRLKEIFYEKNLNYTKLLPHANKILNKFFRINTTVLLTNCRENRALMTLTYHNLINKFDHKIFRMSIDNNRFINKFEHAINIFNLKPQIVIVFENDEFEINEAVKSGIPIENILKL